MFGHWCFASATPELMINVFGAHSCENYNGQKNEDHRSIKIAALQWLQATESFFEIHENANLQAAVPIATC